MRILLDMDQILAKWTERVVEWWNEDNGTALTPDDIHGWNVGEWLGPGGVYFVRSCCRYPEFYRDLEPVEGAIQGVRKLIDDGHDVQIATAVPRAAPMAYVGKVEWIRRQMPFFDLVNLVAIHRKDTLAGDILFDDGAHNIEDFAKTGRMTVMLEKAWNAGVRVEPTKRVKHWNEFVKFVDEVKGQFK